MKKLIIFIHGIGSDSNAWNEMIKCASSDKDLENIFEPYIRNVSSIEDNKMYYYLHDYESKITDIKKRAFGKMPELFTGQKSIGSIFISDHSKTLQTIIEEEIRNFDNISIVAHSMGGLIALHTILNSNFGQKISYLLYGVPLLGSENLDDFKRIFKIDISSEVLQELNPDSITITSINQKISSRKNDLKTNYDITMVFGDLDGRIIKPEENYINSFAEFKQVSGDHSKIIRPNSLSDMSFVLFKNFLLEEKDSIPLSKKNNFDVIVVGGANLEYIYKQNDESKLLIKQSYHKKEVQYGGSALNYFLRLTSTGINVFPIMPVGNDVAGKDILREINKKRKDNSFSLFYDDEIFINNINTIESLIITDKRGRTIWSQTNNQLTPEVFNKYIDDKSKYLNNTKFVLIGHIHSDNVEDVEETTTYKLINMFKNTETILYVNLGKTQLKRGYDFWKNILKYADIIQFNIEEIKYFFGNEKLKLNDILDDLKKLNNNIIITLDKLGAICQNADGEVFYVHEIEIDGEYIDKTGAGDAFASGVVFDLIESGVRKNRVKDYMRVAMKRGRIWATYACLSLGGANNCPNLSQLKDKEEDWKRHKKIKAPEDLNKSLLDLFDKAYSKC